jgi:hypothetical protein
MDQEQQLDQWIKSLVPEFQTLRDGFESGEALIALLQALRPQEKPPSGYRKNPKNPIQKREARTAALAFAKQLGVRGDFEDSILTADFNSSGPHQKLIALLKAVKALGGSRAENRGNAAVRPEKVTPVQTAVGNAAASFDPRPTQSLTQNQSPAAQRPQSQVFNQAPVGNAAASFDPRQTQSPIQIHEAFQFSEDKLDFWPTSDFTTDLKASQCPFIVMLVGNGRTGKSTRANQLVRRELRPDGPFQAENGPDPVTFGFQYAGPLRMSELCQIHHVQPPAQKSDPDVFIIDCEGLHSLGETTPALKQATFSLAQMASVTVLVTRGPLNHDNIASAQALFTLCRAFSRRIPGFATGTVVMETEVGVPTRGKKLNLDESDQLRKEADLKERKAVLNVLNQQTTEFSAKDLLVLAQPELPAGSEGGNAGALYWRSIQDLVGFLAVIAARRERFSGQSLLELFDEAKPSIREIKDFGNLSIRFEDIMARITIRYLSEASSAALEAGRKRISGTIASLNENALRAGMDMNFVGDETNNCLIDFATRARESLPNLLECLPEETTKNETAIQKEIKRLCDERFVERCFAILIPKLATKTLEQIRDEIDVEIKGIPIEHLPAVTFAQLSARYEEIALFRCTNEARNIHSGIPSSSEFSRVQSQLKSAVSSYVLHVETERKQAYSKYQQEETARQVAESQARYQADLDKVTKAEADKRRLIEEEKAKMEKQQKEEAMRYQQELAEAKRRVDAEAARQRELARTLKAAQEKAAAEAEALQARLQADAQANRQKWAAEMEKERIARAEIERTTRLQLSQFEQFKAEQDRLQRENEQRSKKAEADRLTLQSQVQAAQAERQRLEKETKEWKSKAEKESSTTALICSVA